MSNGEQGGVPGYFVGRPINHEEKTKEAPVDGEQMPATTHTPGDYFVGRPESQQQKEEQAQQQQSSKQSTPSFLAKCCPCLAGGGGAD
ncbi:hypothetical protein BS78_05G123300 [Paspalum vaginatum]|nr:hypothetical protein BS78_05G123300 [Paspalum vaginatum]